MPINDLIVGEKEKIKDIKILSKILTEGCIGFSDNYNKIDKKEREEQYEKVEKMKERIVKSWKDIRAHEKIIEVLNEIKEKYQNPIENLKYFFGRNEEGVSVVLNWQGNSGSYFEGEFPKSGPINLGEILTFEKSEDAYNKYKQRVNEIGKNYTKLL